MADPTTVNRLLAIPTRGSDVGTWDVPVNNDMSALDGMFGGFATIALSAATTLALSVPTGAVTPSAGPTQSQNALLKFTGTLAGNCVIQFALPGFYIVDNRCTVGTSYVQLAPSVGTGHAIGAPPGQKVQVFYDGTDMDYVDTMPVGAPLDLHGLTAIPAWMKACTIAPYLLKDGGTYSTITYPALGALLGSTFGGNGITTFGVPDERARARIGYDTGSTNRLTTAVSGVNGATMGSAGGDQNLQAHLHTATGTATYADPAAVVLSGGGGGLQFAGAGTRGQETMPAITVTVAVATTGSGAGANVQPSIVSFLPLIKT